MVDIYTHVRVVIITGNFKGWISFSIFFLFTCLCIRNRKKPYGDDTHTLFHNTYYNVLPEKNHVDIEELTSMRSPKSCTRWGPQRAAHDEGANELHTMRARKSCTRWGRLKAALYEDTYEHPTTRTLPGYSRWWRQWVKHTEHFEELLNKPAPPHAPDNEPGKSDLFINCANQSQCK